MAQQLILDQLFWIRSGSIAQWTAAGGQLLTALMLVVIAYKTFSYSRSSINATVIKHYNDMRQEKLIAKDLEDTTMKNGVSWLATMSRDQLERFLSRGYEPEFRRRIIVEYEVLSK